MTPNAQSFFDFAAEVGLTKHLGGVRATRELAALCRVSAGSYVLDVGCGAGVTPCFLAREYGARVVGVDISARMIERSQERARREGLAGSVTFWTADALSLPFDPDAFDAVLTESVVAFLPDRALGVREFVRVTKPGGFIGLNESSWLREPPEEVLSWATLDPTSSALPLFPGEWRALLEEAGLEEIAVHVRELDPRDEAKGILGRYGVGGMLRVSWRMLRLYARSPAYRRFVRSVRGQGILPANLETYFGYGLYVGRKRPV